MFFSSALAHRAATEFRNFSRKGAKVQSFGRETLTTKDTHEGREDIETLFPTSCPFVCFVVKWNQHALINDENYWVSAEEEARCNGLRMKLP